MSWIIETEPRRIGTMMPTARNRASSVFQRNLYSVRAQAAMAPNRSVKKIVPPVTVIELT
jgi:hypothetical protein